MAAENIRGRFQEIQDDIESQDHCHALLRKAQLRKQNGNAGKRSSRDGRCGHGKDGAHEKSCREPGSGYGNAIGFRRKQCRRKIKDRHAGLVDHLGKGNAEIRKALLDAVLFMTCFQAGGKSRRAGCRGKTDDQCLQSLFQKNKGTYSHADPHDHKIKDQKQNAPQGIDGKQLGGHFNVAQLIV